MRRLCTLAIILAIIIGYGAATQAATLSFSQGYADAVEIFVGGCVVIGFDVMLSGLDESVKELEFSIKMPDGVGLECQYIPRGELKIEGDNFLFTFDECLPAGERIRLVVLFPIYEPVVRGLGCLGPATPSGLELTTAGYRSCSGEIRPLELRSWPGKPEGCVDLYLDQGGLAPEVTWGMMKSVFAQP